MKQKDAYIHELELKINALTQAHQQAVEALAATRSALDRIAVNSHLHGSELGKIASDAYRQAVLATHKDIEHHPACSVCGYTDSEGVPQPPACHPDCLATHKEKG